MLHNAANSSMSCVCFHLLKKNMGNVFIFAKDVRYAWAQGSRHAKTFQKIIISLGRLQGNGVRNQYYGEKKEDWLVVRKHGIL